MNCSVNITFTNDQVHSEDIRAAVYLVIWAKFLALTIQMNKDNTEDYCLLECDTVQSDKSLQMIQRFVLPSSSIYTLKMAYNPAFNGAGNDQY
jgi:hypothetical protein